MNDAIIRSAFYMTLAYLFHTPPHLTPLSRIFTEFLIVANDFVLRYRQMMVRKLAALPEKKVKVQINNQVRILLSMALRLIQNVFDLFFGRLHFQDGCNREQKEKQK